MEKESNFKEIEATLISLFSKDGMESVYALRNQVPDGFWEITPVCASVSTRDDTGWVYFDSVIEETITRAVLNHKRLARGSA